MCTNFWCDECAVGWYFCTFANLHVFFPCSDDHFKEVFLYHAYFGSQRNLASLLVFSLMSFFLILQVCLFEISGQHLNPSHRHILKRIPVIPQVKHLKHLLLALLFVTLPQGKRAQLFHNPHTMGVQHQATRVLRTHKLLGVFPPVVAILRQHKPRRAENHQQKHHLWQMFQWRSRQMDYSPANDWHTNSKKKNQALKKSWINTSKDTVKWFKSKIIWPIFVEISSESDSTMINSWDTSLERCRSWKSTILLLDDLSISQICNHLFKSWQSDPFFQT